MEPRNIVFLSWTSSLPRSWIACATKEEAEQHQQALLEGNRGGITEGNGVPPGTRMVGDEFFTPNGVVVTLGNLPRILPTLRR